MNENERLYEIMCRKSIGNHVTPIQSTYKDSDVYSDNISTLTKRELFAAMAMQGCIANGDDNRDVISIFSVKCADSLLEELNK